MPTLPDFWRACATFDDALTLARNHGGTVISPDDPTGEKGYADTARRILALQDAIEAGTWRVKCEWDDDYSPLDNDDSDPELAAARDDERDKLERGIWIVVGIILESRDTWRNERTGATAERWEAHDSLWGIVCEPGDPYLMVTAADMFPDDDGA